jgi:two-component system, sensor histidine kinase and response regulator
VIYSDFEDEAGAAPHPETITLCFEVTESGIGMTEKQIGRLFESFTQADTSTPASSAAPAPGSRSSRN